MPTESTVPNRAIIPGLHFFCDHRCWRCSLAQRCQVPIRLAEHPTGPRAGSGPAGRVAEVVLASLYVTVEQVETALADLPLNTPSVAPRRLPERAPGGRDRQDASERDPLVAAAKEYASGSLRVLHALRPRLARASDPVAIDAGDRLEETCLTVASKVHRAVTSAEDEEWEAVDPQGDANGSAKVALLLIEESREAWRLLMQPGRSMGNGAPARFVRTLEKLEAGLHERFPRALEFVRPGFDTVAPDRPPAEAEVARALLQAGQVRGSA